MHVYIHVPFCARRCSYCDFAIAVRRTVPSERFVDLVLAEWDRWQEHPAWGDSPEIRTLYFGGGTPSLLAPSALDRLLDGVARARSLAAGAEVTLEANPDDVTPAAARAWRAAGINRVSLGVQSFDPVALRWMHRAHLPAQAVAAVQAVRAAGLENLSLDLIFGLPPGLERRWGDDLARALALAPDHLSLYGLTVEEHTPLGRWASRGDIAPVPDDTYAAEFLSAHSVLREHGWEHYEVSNAARPGRRAEHNIGYWRRAPYLGLGPSAHSGFGTVRQWNLRNWSAYERAAAAGDSVVAGREELGEAEVELEELYLGLRTAEGLPAARIPTRTASEWIGAGWAEASQGRLRLTAEGWLRLDALVGTVARRAARVV